MNKCCKKCNGYGGCDNTCSCHQSPDNSVGSWEKRLSHKFDFMIEQGIKEKLWTEFERKAFKFLEKSIREDIEEALADSRSQVVEIIKEMKEPECCPDAEYKDDYCCNRNQGFNQALSDLLDKLK